jgi:hypothetical protein
MNTKFVAVLGCVTAMLGGVAFIVQNRQKATTQVVSNAKLFAWANAADVARVMVQRGEKKIEIAREGERWVVASSDGYPALDDRVREIVRRVVESEIVEEKTSNAELYARLGVEDATAPDAKGTLVSLAKADGTNIARLIIGNRQDAANWDAEKAATFVRPADGTKSYLVRATFNAGLEPVDWMQREVLNFGADRFWNVTVTPASGEGVTIARSTPAAEPALANVPAGRELVSPDKPRQVLEALASVSLDDVRKVERIDFSQATVATYTTFQGVTFTVRSAAADGKTWVHMSVAYDANAAAPLAEGATAPSAETVAAITKEASDLQARLAPWAFVLPDWKVANLRLVMGDMLKALDASAPGAEGAEAMPPGLAPLPAGVAKPQ